MHIPPVPTSLSGLIPSPLELKGPFIGGPQYRINILYFALGKPIQIIIPIEHCVLLSKSGIYGIIFKFFILKSVWAC